MERGGGPSDSVDIPGVRWGCGNTFENKERKGWKEGHLGTFKSVLGGGPQASTPDQPPGKMRRKQPDPHDSLLLSIPLTFPILVSFSKNYSNGELYDPWLLLITPPRSMWG